MKSVPGVSNKHIIHEEKDKEEGYSTHMEQPCDHWTPFHLYTHQDFIQDFFSGGGRKSLGRRGGGGGGGAPHV